MSKEFVSASTLFTRDNNDTPAEIVIPAGWCVAVIVRGEKPIIHDLDGQGEYLVDCPENPSDVWPVAICVIDRAHKPAWEKITIETVDRMLDRCQRAIDRRQAGLPINNGDVTP